MPSIEKNLQPVYFFLRIQACTLMRIVALCQYRREERNRPGPSYPSQSSLYGR